MSTKIWTAWRLPADRLNDFLDLMHPRMFAAVIREVDEQSKFVRPAVVERGMAEYSSGTRFSREATERHVRTVEVLKVAQDAAVRQSFLSLDCGLNIWLDGSYAYVMPYGSAAYYQEIAIPPWVSDYHYQDSVDRPSRISAAEWKERGDTWDRIALDKDRWTTRRLRHAVIDMDVNGMGASRIRAHYLRLARTEKDATETPQEG